MLVVIIESLIENFNNLKFRANENVIENFCFILQI